jgi:hypothetical protein
MYGFTGLGANTYAARRYPPIFGPLVQFSMTTLQLSRTPGILQPKTVVQGDYGYTIPFTLLDASGNAVNLAGAVLSMRLQSAQDPSDTLDTLNGYFAIDSAAAGTCHYQVSSGDFPAPGTYLAQVVATWTSNEVLTWSGLTIIVEPSLPKTNN